MPLPHLGSRKILILGVQKVKPPYCKLYPLALAALCIARASSEITEETLIVDIVKTCAIITELQSYGIEVSVDDFGTGYSSLQYLKDMPFNTMKIDKTFIDGVPGDIYSEAIIRASVEMAGALKLKVVAEGVETKEQWAIVKQLGCHLVQGYVVSKPVAPDEFLVLLHQWNT